LEDLLETLARGNPTEVKVLLASAALALAVYQLVLIAVGYGKVRPPFLSPGPASFAHRAVGDAIVVILAFTALTCVSVYGVEDDAAAHIAAALGLLGVLTVKIVVVRWWHSMNRFLPILGISVWVLLALTWVTSAGIFLADS